MSVSIEDIRNKQPLIHNITNQVVANDVANALLAISASPMMAYAAEEMEEVATIADAIVLNTGTLTDSVLDAMLIVGKAANRLEKPIVLDPVGVGATSYRQKSIALLLDKVDIQLIRGNAGELASLVGVEWQAKGVDAGVGSASVGEIARLAAEKYQTVVFISGEADVISDGRRTVYIRNGDPLMTQITGTGCMLSGICGAFIAVGEDVFESAVAASATYAIAGELAVEELNPIGPGYFRPTFMNQLYHITNSTVKERLNMQEEISNE